MLLQKQFTQWEMQNSTAAPAVINKNKNQLDAKINQHLNDLEQNNLLTLENGVYQLDILYKQGKMNVNGHLLSEEESTIFLLLLLQL